LSVEEEDSFIRLARELKELGQLDAGSLRDVSHEIIRLSVYRNTAVVDLQGDTPSTIFRLPVLDGVWPSTPFS
jgi:hypothetical protein